MLYAYSERAAKVWWPQVKEKLSGHRNLRVRFLDDEQMAKLAALSNRNMSLQATLQEGTIWLSDDQNNLEISFDEWQGDGQ